MRLSYLNVSTSINNHLNINMCPRRSVLEYSAIIQKSWNIVQVTCIWAFLWSVKTFWRKKKSTGERKSFRFGTTCVCKINTFVSFIKLLSSIYYVITKKTFLRLKLSKKRSENFSCVTFQHKCSCLIGGAWHRVSEASPFPRALHEK